MIMQDAWTDPVLFHALSLILSIADNGGISNVESLTHRGKLLTGLCDNM